MDKYNIGMFIISKAVVEATACFNFFICDRMIGLDMCVDANEMCHNHAPTTPFLPMELPDLLVI